MATVSGQAESVESADATSGQLVDTGTDDVLGWAHAPASNAASSDTPIGRLARNELK
jgi:hypothetical protein